MAKRIVFSVSNKVAVRVVEKKKPKRIHGCKVYQLAKGLTRVEAYSAICSRVRRIFFKYWSYDAVTGKARAMG